MDFAPLEIEEPRVEFEEQVQTIPVEFEELSADLPVEFDVAYVSGQRKPATVTVKDNISGGIKEFVFVGYYAKDDFQIETINTERTLEGLRVGDTFLLSTTSIKPGQFNVTATGAKARMFVNGSWIESYDPNDGSKDTKYFRDVNILVRVTDPVASVTVGYTETN